MNEKGVELLLNWRETILAIREGDLSLIQKFQEQYRELSRLCLLLSKDKQDILNNMHEYTMIRIGRIKIKRGLIR